MKESPHFLPIIGIDRFNIGEADVLTACQEAQDRVEGFTQLLNHPNVQVRQVAAKGLIIVNRQLAALSQEPSNILKTIRATYQRTLELEQSGAAVENIAHTIGNEFPDIVAYYELLRMQNWGYRLVQHVIGSRSE